MIKKVILPVLVIASLQYAYAAKMPKPNKEMDTVLTSLAAKGGKPIEQLDAKEARKQPTPTDAVKTVMADKKISAASTVTTKEIQVDGADGMIPARIYIPAGANKPMPVVVYYHGGGFVIADNDVYDATPRALADQTKAIFVSVEYRKAPEFKFPAAHDDAIAAYKWVLKNAASFDGDPKRVAVAGESAGGNLALNVAIAARDRKFQLPVHELLIYPVAGSYMGTASYKENANAKPLSREMMSWFMNNYLADPKQKDDKRINLLTANFQGLSNATIITAQIDPLRSEGMELAEKMKASGVDVKYKNYNGVTHEFFGMAPVLQEAKKAQEFAAKDLSKAFRQ
ncbi:MAG: alpha/beta hydrolase [Bacteriovorax sp.]|nr:alpha/beta hydrolase [Bacteriovorax sp.]